MSNLPQHRPVNRAVVNLHTYLLVHDILREAEDHRPGADDMSARGEEIFTHLAVRDALEDLGIPAGATLDYFETAAVRRHLETAFQEACQQVRQQFADIEVALDPFEAPEILEAAIKRVQRWRYNASERRRLGKLYYWPR